MTSRVGRTLAVVLCAAIALSACGSGGEDDGKDGGTAQEGTSSPTPSSSSASPTEATEPSTPAEPEVTPVTGPWLDTRYAKIRVPKGWKVADNFGFDNVQQASTRKPYTAGVHFAVYQREPSVTSLEAAARHTARDLRTRLKMGRFTVGDEVVVGGVRATRLDGRGTPLLARTAYAVMVGDLRWMALFDFDQSMPEEERETLMASVLDTWEFVRP